MSVRHKFLVLGPMAKDHELQGGLTISFGVFLEQLQKNNIDFEVINTNKVNYKFKGVALIFILAQFFLKVRKCTHVSLHGTANDYIYLAPVVIFFSKLFAKTVSLRKFAGGFLEVFEKLGSTKKTLVKYALSNADINYFQTKYLVEYFKQFNGRTFWFPTVRNKPEQTSEKDSTYQKRFVYLGHIRPEKGIDQICEVSNLLDDTYGIDLYGSIMGEKYSDSFWDKYANVTYKGKLQPADVYSTLSKYDVLLLPTYWTGEGYPGVIIEAFALGMPVISTNMGGIGEIVTEGTGLIIEAKNVQQLKDAIMYFNEQNYVEYSAAASENFSQFDADVQIRKIIGQIKGIM